MIAEHLLNRTASVYKSAGTGGAHSYEDAAAFTWPCWARPADLSAQVQATSRIAFSEWIIYGNAPEGDGTIVKGDKLVLEDSTIFYVTSAAPRKCPQGEYLVLTANRSE